jgi:hypothetical protein
VFQAIGGGDEGEEVGQGWVLGHEVTPYFRDRTLRLRHERR